MLNGSSGDMIGGKPRWSFAGMPSRMRLGAIQWLILSAVVLVIAIMLGTGYFALQYRERALEVAERELNNSALLLSRHFDQQLGDLQHVHEDVVAQLARRRGPYGGRFRKEDVDIERARDAAHEARGAAACRRPESVERQAAG